MTSEQIRKKLDDLYADKKARNFFNHLVRAYFPVSKVEKVVTKPKGPFKCVLTNENLISVDEVLVGIHSDEFKADFMNHIKTMFDAASSQHPMAKLFGDRKLGISSEDTNTNMAYSSYQDFYDWIITKMLMGDKHINGLLKDISRGQFMDRAETIQNPELQKKISGVKKATTTSATYTLGDTFSVLQALKDKMENN